jgi:flagellar biosynthesis/type III secretory pathway protein FliH
MTWAEQLEQQALEQGRQQGRQEGLALGRELERVRLLDKLRRPLEAVLVLRFGPLPEAVQQALADADEDELERLMSAFPEATSLEALFP